MKITYGYSRNIWPPPTILAVCSWRFRFWAVLTCACTILCCTTPLFDTLGFGFAFALAILLSFACIDLGAAWTRIVRSHGPVPSNLPTWKTLLFLIRTSLHTTYLLLAIPFLLMAANSMRTPTCDWWFGIQAYIFLPISSGIAATIIGVLIGLACGLQRKLSVCLPIVTVVVSFVYALWKFYSQPPAFFYHIFAGYFPGNLYDENVDFHAPFFWARLYHLSILASLFCLSMVLFERKQLRLRIHFSHPRFRPSLVLGLVGSFAITLLLSLSAGKLRFSITTKDIHEHLPGRYETEHFVIRYPLGGNIARMIELIAKDHEFRYKQVATILNATVPQRIVSYYFATRTDKFRYIGARKR